MNFIDKIFYFIYLYNATPRKSRTPGEIESDNKKFMSMSQGAFLISMGLYLNAIMFYTGLIFFIGDSRSRQAFLVLSILLMIAFILIYFSKKRMEEIIEHFEMERANSKKTDWIWGLLFVLGSFAFVLVYLWLKDIGAPIPLIQSIFNVKYIE